MQGKMMCVQVGQTRWKLANPKNWIQLLGVVVVVVDLEPLLVNEVDPSSR